MSKIICFLLIIGLSIFYSTVAFSLDACKVYPDRIACLERGPCEPINEFLIRAAKVCRDDETLGQTPIIKMTFVNILSKIIRLDRDFPEINNLPDEERYVVEVRLLSEKGIDIFSETNAFEPLTRKELATVLKKVVIEENLGYSSGLADQDFALNNDAVVIYDAKVYVEDELWERKRTFEDSSPESKYYIVKIDSRNDALVVFGDGEKGKVPLVGSKLKASYRLYGRETEIITECEIVDLLSNTYLTRSIKNAYNPSRPLTKATFADLLIKALQLEKELPGDTASLTEEELYLVQTGILAKHGIDISGKDGAHVMLTREELARVLYDYPVERIIGISSGKQNQSFDLENAGFVIYDLHTYVDEAIGYEEWNKQDSFIGSSSRSEDYLVKLDAGNYANIYFGDDKKGRIPAINSPIKVSYRLYAPVSMFTEDDIICMLNFPVAEAYEPPPYPPPDYPPPTDGFDDPATHT